MWKLFFCLPLASRSAHLTHFLAAPNERISSHNVQSPATFRARALQFVPVQIECGVVTEQLVDVAHLAEAILH
jgi:hypothetical protein